jgi:hypothetical protein
MPLAIDASSPAVHSSTAADNVSASFTPPDASLVLSTWGCDTDTGVDPGSPTPSDSASHTWVTDGWDHRASGVPTVNGQAGAFHTYLAASSGAMTVDILTGTLGTYGSIQKVYVITGADPGTPVALAQGGRQSSGTSISDSYTAAITGGQGFMVVADWAGVSTAAWTAAGGCTMVDKGTLSGSIGYAVLQRTTADDVLGAATTMGLTGLSTGGQYHWVLLEVVSVEAASARFRTVVVGGDAASNW